LEGRVNWYSQLMAAFGIFVLVYSAYMVLSALLSLQGGRNDEAQYSLMIGLIGIALASSSLFLMRKRALQVKPPPEVFTVVRCSGCGFRLVRRFQVGDYVNADIGQCQQCNGRMTIASIYAESEGGAGA
jgi:Co/Zn/Cd efflux system component